MNHQQIEGKTNEEFFHFFYQSCLEKYEKTNNFREYAISILEWTTKEWFICIEQGNVVLSIVETYLEKGIKTLPKELIKKVLNISIYKWLDIPLYPLYKTEEIIQITEKKQKIENNNNHENFNNNNNDQQIYNESSFWWSIVTGLNVLLEEEWNINYKPNGNNDNENNIIPKEIRPYTYCILKYTMQQLVTTLSMIEKYWKTLVPSQDIFIYFDFIFHLTSFFLWMYSDTKRCNMPMYREKHANIENHYIGNRKFLLWTNILFHQIFTSKEIYININKINELKVINKENQEYIQFEKSKEANHISLWIENIIAQNLTDSFMDRFREWFYDDCVGISDRYQFSFRGKDTLEDAGNVSALHVLSCLHYEDVKVYQEVCHRPVFDILLLDKKKITNNNNKKNEDNKKQINHRCPSVLKWMIVDYFMETELARKFKDIFFIKEIKYIQYIKNLFKNNNNNTKENFIIQSMSGYYLPFQNIFVQSFEYILFLWMILFTNNEENKKENNLNIYNWINKNILIINDEEKDQLSKISKEDINKNIEINY